MTSTAIVNTELVIYGLGGVYTHTHTHTHTLPHESDFKKPAIKIKYCHAMHVKFYCLLKHVQLWPLLHVFAVSTCEQMSV